MATAAFPAAFVQDVSRAPRQHLSSANGSDGTDQERDSTNVDPPPSKRAKLSALSLPYGLWDTYRSNDARKRRCEIIAFSSTEGKYVVRDTIDEHHYLFSYDQMCAHFVGELKNRASGKTPVGKPTTTAQQQQQQTKRNGNESRGRKRHA